MKNRCEGCGAKIQTTNPLGIGYIKSEVYLKNPDNFLCERCYNITHYNKNVKVNIDEKVFLDNALEIAKSNGLVVFICDVFDLEGTFINNINEIFVNNKILFIANKFDLFLSSTKATKIKDYIRGFLTRNNTHVNDLLIVSSKSDNDIDLIIKKIDNLLDTDKIFFFGMTNVGKSSLIKAVLKKLYQKDNSITISNIPGTTLDMLKIALGNKTYIYDTPGIINNCQYTYYLEQKTLDYVMPKKFIKPKVYQILENQTVFIGGFVIVNIVSGKKCSIITNFSNNIVIHRTKYSNYVDFFEKHKDDILLYPTLDERTKLGSMEKRMFEIDIKSDISISGLGFITIVPTEKLIVEVITYKPIKVTLRKAIL